MKKLELEAEKSLTFNDLLENQYKLKEKKEIVGIYCDFMKKDVDLCKRFLVNKNEKVRIPDEKFIKSHNFDEIIGYLSYDLRPPLRIIVNSANPLLELKKIICNNDLVEKDKKNTLSLSQLILNPRRSMHNKEQSSPKKENASLKSSKTKL